MTPAETTTILRQFNDHRRGCDVPSPKPSQIGRAIDAAIEMIERLEAAETAWKISDQTVYDLTEKVIPNIQEKLEAAEKERDAAELMSLALRAKIAKMEQQEPIGGMLEISPHNYELRWYRPVPFGAKLYTLPGAQPQLNEIKIALQQALELGQRETWTETRKHRSREDQREEQQCWNKVWSLLGAQGEEK